MAANNKTQLVLGHKYKYLNTKPICNAPISPSRKPESEAREATVTGSDQRTCGVKEFAFKIAFKTTDTSCSTTVKTSHSRPLAHKQNALSAITRDV